MKRTHVAVLRGGPSTEYDVSLKTGASVLNALIETDYVTHDIVITRTGEWLVGGRVRSPEQALVAVDVVFNALHGSYGEDGGVQRLLDRLCIPYTGSGSYASAIAMNKILTKDHLRNLGIALAPHMQLSRERVSDVDRSAYAVSQLFGPEFVVKPIRGGSSIGTFVARSTAELARVLEQAFAQHSEVIVEERIQGKEATVGVIEDYRDTPVYVLPVIEIAPGADVDHFSYETKYGNATSEIEICPGRFSQTEKDSLAHASQLVHERLGLRHYSRSDFMVRDGVVYFLEVNTLPGLTETSLFPKAISAVGGNYRDFIQHVLERARI